MSQKKEIKTGSQGEQKSTRRNRKVAGSGPRHQLTTANPPNRLSYSVTSVLFLFTFQRIKEVNPEDFKASVPLLLSGGLGFLKQEKRGNN